MRRRGCKSLGRAADRARRRRGGGGRRSGGGRRRGFCVGDRGLRVRRGVGGLHFKERQGFHCLGGGQPQLDRRRLRGRDGLDRRCRRLVGRVAGERGLANLGVGRIGGEGDRERHPALVVQAPRRRPDAADHRADRRQHGVQKHREQDALRKRVRLQPAGADDHREPCGGCRPDHAPDDPQRMHGGPCLSVAAVPDPAPGPARSCRGRTEMATFRTPAVRQAS